MLTTVELREHLKLPPEKDGEVAALRDSVIDLFETETHGFWNEREEYVEEILLRTDRLQVAALKLQPITEVETVEERSLSVAEWTELEPEDFVVEDGARLRKLSGVFLRSLRVTYTGGWTAATVPGAIKRALIVQARFILGRTAGENLITAAQAVEGGSTTLLRPDIHPLFAQVVQQYRRLT